MRNPHLLSNRKLAATAMVTLLAALSCGDEAKPDTVATPTEGAVSLPTPTGIGTPPGGHPPARPETPAQPPAGGQAAGPSQPPAAGQAPPIAEPPAGAPPPTPVAPPAAVEPPPGMEPPAVEPPAGPPPAAVEPPTSPAGGAPPIEPVAPAAGAANGGALTVPVTPPPPPRGNSNKIRVMASSDIGGTDTDDQQSMVHFLVYADHWDVEGLISSPWGAGRKKDILDLIDLYEQDYPNLSTHSDYPTPEHLRSVTKQGATAKAPGPGFTEATEASEWIYEVAMRDDPRPLWITIWGAPDDVAQVLHDHPEVTPKLRVYWIAGPNRALNANAARYISENHKDLWIIEADQTYRGFFKGGDMSGDYGNGDWPKKHVAGHGALGDYFMSHRSDIKMGDTPAVLYTLDNVLRTPDDPTQPGWGGAFVPQVDPNRSCSDKPARAASEACCGGVRPNCWMDNTDPAVAAGGYEGAQTVAKHRKAWLDDWGAMMDRAQAPK